MSHDLDALPRSGAVSRALAKWFFRAARVTDVAKLSPRFRLFTLRGEQLRALAWEPGQKVQIVVGPGMTWRTYTPITWDPDAGQTRLLGFRHGEGPASQWLAKLAAGTDCAVFGPRRSLDVAASPTDIVLFGDETSFALAAALRATFSSRPILAVFEVSDRTEAQTVLGQIGLAEAIIVERSTSESHLEALAGQVSAFGAERAGQIVLTGRAPAIQFLSRSLKAAGLGPRIRAKAYWAPGKVGLD